MSNAVQFHSRVGDDGVLHVQLDLGRAEARKEVVVTVQPLPNSDGSPSPNLSWREFIERTYGSCAGLGLEWQDQGVFEEPR